MLGLRLKLLRSLAYRWWCLYVTSCHCWPVALHHLIGDAAPQHRPALVHKAGEVGMSLGVCDPLLVIDASVQSDVYGEGMNRPEFAGGSNS
jgi:hypothetical protein